ncbi:hypothetical protein ACU5AX_20340, partial [Sphingomonas sp. XXL09]|uniref:hypothetical protein n=1 Tax=Sphingomonas sp. XXL09 TaxID=3457787 RepID=UPI00406BA90D
SQFGKITGYADYIKAFAENIVHQMQAARLLRINHGALSASNMTVDGRWIDTAAASVLPPGADYAPESWIPCYSLESAYVRSVLSEWVYTAEKFTGRQLSRENLLEFYNLRSSRFKIVECCRLFGVRGLNGSIYAAERFSDLVDRTINKSLKLSRLLQGGRGSNVSDPAVDLLVNIHRLNAGSLELVGHPDHGYVEIIKSYLNSHNKNRSTWDLQRIFAEGLKKFLFAPLFYRGRIIANCSTLVISGRFDEASKLIARFQDEARWVFSVGDRATVLVDFGGLMLSHNESGSIMIKYRDEETYVYGKARYSDALAIVESRFSDKLKTDPHYCYPAWESFNLFPALVRLLQELAFLEDIKKA